MGGRRKVDRSSKQLAALSRRPQETASIVVLCDKFYSINCSADEVTSTGAHARAHREVAESTQPRALARRPKGVGRGGRRANRTHRPNPHSESQKFPVPAARAPCRRRASARPTKEKEIAAVRAALAAAADAEEADGRAADAEARAEEADGRAAQRTSELVAHADAIAKLEAELARARGATITARVEPEKELVAARAALAAADAAPGHRRRSRSDGATARERGGGEI